MLQNEFVCPVSHQPDRHPLAHPCPLQVAIVFYQNMLAIPRVYGVSVPAEWYNWLTLFDWANLDLFNIYDIKCMGGASSQLNAKALGSLAVVFIMLLLGPLCMATMHLTIAAKLNSKRTRNLLFVGVPWALFAVFALVPGVSRTIFRAWSCKKFLAHDVDGTSVEFLAAQTSVRCHADEHNSIIEQAIVYLILWCARLPFDRPQISTATTLTRAWPQAGSFPAALLHSGDVLQDGHSRRS